jgi:hypothetical protein
MLQLIHNTDGTDTHLECVEFINQYGFKPHFKVSDVRVKDNRIFALRPSEANRSKFDRVLVDKSLLPVSPY